MHVCMKYSPILNPPKRTLHYFAKYYSRQYFVLYGSMHTFTCIHIHKYIVTHVYYGTNQPQLEKSLIYDIYVLGVTDSGVGQMKPSLTNCSVRSTRLLQHACGVMHNVTLQWRMAEDVLNEINSYYFYCNCHNYKTGVTKMVSATIVFN